LVIGLPRVRIEQSRDAEIQELRFPFRRDTDISRFEIPVNDKVLMRVGNSRANFAEESQPLSRLQAMLRRVGLERDALDVFHHKIRQAILSDRAAIKPGNLRMIEGSEDALLLPKMPYKFLRPEALLDQLDRNLTAEVGVVGEIDFPHAAFPEQRSNPVVTEHLASA
jgi:hypothetical protein